MFQLEVPENRVSPVKDRTRRSFSSCRTASSTISGSQVVSSMPNQIAFTPPRAAAQ